MARVVQSVDLAQEAPRCWCGERATVRKTRRRRIVTLAGGDTTIRIRDYVCKKHEIPEVFPVDESLGDLVPERQRFGWDVIVEVGLQRYLRRRQRTEIQRELQMRDRIRVSTGTISNLADRFVHCLGRLHRERSPILRAFFANRGGYALHIDSTNETGRGGLFVGMEGTQGWVLSAGRIETEREDQLTSTMDEIVDLFGLPLAVVRDMSKACQAAVRPLHRQGSADLVCHFHFVQNVGRALLRRRHNELQRILRRTEAKSLLKSLDQFARQTLPLDAEQANFAALVYWLRHGEDRRPIRFPFCVKGRDLYYRLLHVPRAIDFWLDPQDHERHRDALDALRELHARLAESEKLSVVVANLQHRWSLFEELRRILRLEGDELMRPREPLLPEAEIQEREKLQDEIDRFRQRLQARAAQSKRGPHALVLRYLDRYEDELFHHPHARDEHGQLIWVTERTNNPLEQLFGASKQNMRRRTGRCRLARDLEDLPPDAMLTMNLRDPRYVRMLCGSLDNLPRAFAQLGSAPRANNIRQHPSRSVQTTVRNRLRNTPEPLIATAA